jgi:multiple sugar transport system substrate-binding protein
MSHHQGDSEKLRPLSSGRRQFLKSVTFVAGAAIAGCAPRETNGARVTLTQWYHQYGEEGTEAAVRRYAQEYTKAFPDIAVKVTWVPGDYGTKLNTALLTAGGPDVFEKQLSVPMVTAGQVVPLDDLFTPEVRRDFLPKDLDLNRVDGKIYGIKMVGDTGVLYYRKSLLAKAGIAPPRTFDELQRAAKALTTKERKGLFLGNDGGVGALLTIAPWSAGSDFLVDNRLVFNNARTALAYEKLRDLQDDGSLLIGAPTDWWDPSAFNQGLCAIAWGGLWAFPAIKKALGDDVGGMAWPALDAAGTPATFSGGWSQMVNAQGRNIEEAKKFVRWLWIENRKIQEDWNLSYGFHVPPCLSVAKNARALDDPVAAQAVTNLQKYGRLTPPAWTNSMNTALSDAATKIVKQGRDARAELNEAERKCRRELERLLR